MIDKSTSDRKLKKSLLFHCQFDTIIGKCEYSIYCKSKFFIHLRGHTNERPYVCNFPGCKQPFGMQGNLDQHYNVVHGGLKPFICNHCGFTFSKKYNLMIHLRSIENSCMKKKRREQKDARKHLLK
jgi:uncharacterized Zn-finger protein